MIVLIVAVCIVLPPFVLVFISGFLRLFLDRPNDIFFFLSMIPNAFFLAAWPLSFKWKSVIFLATFPIGLFLSWTSSIFTFCIFFGRCV